MKLQLGCFPNQCCSCNRCLLSGTFPEVWKESAIIPLARDGKAGLIGNCRCSILPVLSKTIFNQMASHFNKNGILTSAQHAYRPGNSTSTASVHMTDHWLTHALGFYCRFDVTDHSILPANLECFSSLGLAWMKSYISV